MKSLILLLLLTSILTADVERICKVSYLRNDGYSKGVAMQVVFATGKEMNDAGNSFDYDNFSHYALLSFADGKVAIIKFEDLLVGVGDTFGADDFKAQFNIFSEKQATQINDKSGRKWKIEAKDIVNWIDPRVK